MKRIYGILIPLIPTFVAIYLLYWLEKSGTWIPETPHRDKITIVILVLGLGLSFFLKSRYFQKK